MGNYKAFSASVIGKSHINKGIVCQDHSLCFNGENVNIAAVSDGHGDSACFRSDKGSEFAVTACVEGLRKLADEIQEGNISPDVWDNEKSRNSIFTQLAAGIVARWNILIQEDIVNEPVYAI